MFLRYIQYNYLYQSKNISKTDAMIELLQRNWNRFTAGIPSLDLHISAYMWTT